jgi:serine/threonine protein kinase
MPGPSNSNSEHPLPSDPRHSESRQETLLLSDVPNATVLAQEMAASQISSSTLSPTALAALSQRYDILAEAGHGAMGNVYKARDLETGETVALKLLRPEIASDQLMIERFKNELLFARKITHKNVCRVHEFNRIGGIAFTSMEFVEGESLRSVLNRFGGFPPRKGIDIALQICSGLKEAHAQGIVHRDLKPENVMIDNAGNVKIMDFGIARSMEALTKLTGSVIGTPAYMAPEQVSGKPVDYRTDIYSLGLMLYEMFTGSQAFHADTAVALALKQLREAPPLPHDVEPSIPAVVERAILKCLEKEPEKRYQSVAELENVLRSRGTTGTTGTTGVMPAVVPVAQSSDGIKAIPPASLAPKQEPKRKSAVWLILLMAVTTVLALGGLGARKTWKKAEMLPPPEALPLPQPPAFALERAIIPPVAANPPATKPTANHSLKKSAPTTAKAEKPQASSSQGHAPNQTANIQPDRSLSLPALQQRSERVLGQSSSTSNANGTTYLWVGRYGKEESAQKAEKKITDLGLPVVLLPRHGPTGEFYVVFAGPFSADRASSVTEWLESQGFSNVRPVKSPFGLGKSEQNSKQ